MTKNIIPVLVAIILIIIIGAVGIGSILIEKYSYSDERADLNEYFGVSGEQLAIVIQDKIVEEKAILRNGICYFDIDTVDRYLNEDIKLNISNNITDLLGLKNDISIKEINKIEYGIYTY